MLRYRPFRNSDPPKLVAIWRAQAGRAGLVFPVSADLLEQLVLGKLYFEPQGLVLAEDDGQPVGFAHAGFGPSESEDAICTELGVVCLVLVRPDGPQAEVTDGLIEQCEAYLQRRGSRVVYGGAIRPLNPFYFGLYGGSELPGVLDTDVITRQVYTARGYREIERTVIFQLDLSRFQPPVSRQQIQIRRRTFVESIVDPPPRSWWEASTVGDFDLTRFELLPRGGGQRLASATFRSMEPAFSGRFARAVGLIDLHVDPTSRRQGIATFLLSEAMRHLDHQAIALVEAQTMRENSAALALYRKLGFQEVAGAGVFRKGDR